jgi:hypothetical protein
LKNEHLDNLEKGIYNYDAGIIYNDIFRKWTYWRLCLQCVESY